MKVKNINDIKPYLGETVYLVTFSDGEIFECELTGYKYVWTSGKEMHITLDGIRESVPFEQVVDELPDTIESKDYVALNKRLAEKLSQLMIENFKYCRADFDIPMALGILDYYGVKYEIIDDASNDKKKTKRRKKKATKNDK